MQQQDKVIIYKVAKGGVSDYSGKYQSRVEIH